jgi:hypothetical protein
MTKWEYRTAAIEVHASWSGPKPDRSDLDRQLAQYGSEGWELVSAIPNTALTRAPILLIFKRHKA